MMWVHDQWQTYICVSCAEALAHHWLAVSTVLLALLPIPYLFTGYSPVVAPAMWEFTLVRQAMSNEIKAQLLD